MFVISGYVADSVRHYLGDGTPVHALPDISQSGTGLEQATRLIDDATHPGDDFWLLTSRTFHGDPNALLVNQLEEDADVEPEALVEQRLDALKKQITDAWEELNCCYELVVEPEVFWRLGAPPAKGKEVSK